MRNPLYCQFCEEYDLREQVDPEKESASILYCLHFSNHSAPLFLDKLYHKPIEDSMFKSIYRTKIRVSDKFRGLVVLRSTIGV